MIKQLIKFWPQILIFLVIGIFFSNLFFPEPSIFVTPDYGRSDLIHFNIPIKSILAESLRNFELPLWEPRIGQGFPVLDEGQIGFFYLPNIILFAIFPFWLAFNLGYVITFIISAFGTYLLARSFKISQVGSTLAALTFSFSPMMVLQIHHYNFIQTLSLFPWILYLINEFFETKKYRYLLFFSLVIALQVFTGFQQITAYSLTAAVIFFIYKQTKAGYGFAIKSKIFLIFVFFVLLGLAISSVQIAASLRLAQEARRTAIITPQKILSDFPYKPSNVLTIFNPYIQGNPKEGTYPTFQTGGWGIFWENTTYFGLVQLALVCTLFVLIVIKPKKEKDKRLIVFLIAFGLLGIVLSLGKAAPLHPVFSFPPFSFFRIPSRFLVFTFISASILAGLSLDKIPLKKTPLIRSILIFSLITLAITDIFRVWFNYHLIEPKDEVLKPSIFTEKIDKNTRLFSAGIEREWTDTFVKVRWQKDNYAYYDFLKTSLAENANILSDVSQQKAYAGIKPRRSEIVTSFIDGSFVEKGGSLMISPIGKKLLDANNVGYLTTTKPLDSSNWELVDRANFKDHSLYLYNNPKEVSRAYIATDYQVATTIGEFRQILEKQDADILKTVVLEEDIGLLNSDQETKGEVEIALSDNTRVELQAKLNQKSLVVLSDSYYPGWKTYIDEQETKILPVNINSRAVIVPAGNHKIEYVYAPTNIKIGLLVSFLSLVLAIGVFKLLKMKNFY